MRCNYCGAEVKEGMKFCPGCGQEIQQGKGSSDHGSGTIFQPGEGKKREFNGQKVPNASQPPKEPSKNKKVKKKRKKAPIILGFVLVVILAAGGSVLAFYVKSPARKIVSRISQEDYSDIEQLYKKKVKGHFVQEKLLNQLAEKDCATILDDFKTEKITYEEASEKLNAYLTLGSKTLETAFGEQEKTLESLNSSMEAYKKAEELYEDGNYEEAMEAYAQVSEDDSNYEEAQSKLSQCVENYKTEILNQTENPEDEQGYETAIQTIAVAADILPDDEDLAKRLTELKDSYAAMLKSDALDHGTQYMNEGNYEELFTLLKKAQEVNEGDSELENLKKSAEDAYVKAVQDTVDSYLANDNYDDAITYLKSATRVLESNSTLTALLQQVQENVPVKLCDLKISESDSFESGEELKVMEDSVGNIYSPGNLYKFTPYSGRKGYASYYANGEYTRMTGTIAVADDSSKDTGIVTVYDENEKILYTTGEITRTTAPIKVDVDLSGVKWFTVCAEDKGSWGFNCFISDFVLYKN